MNESIIFLITFMKWKKSEIISSDANQILDSRLKIVVILVINIFKLAGEKDVTNYSACNIHSIIKYVQILFKPTIFLTKLNNKAKKSNSRYIKENPFIILDSKKSAASLYQIELGSTLRVKRGNSATFLFGYRGIDSWAHRF